MRRIYTGRNDKHGDFICVVKKFKLSFFCRGSNDDHRIGTIENFLLTIRPVSTFFFLIAASNLVFHFPQGMKHLDDGDIPFLL